MLGDFIVNIDFIAIDPELHEQLINDIQTKLNEYKKLVLGGSSGKKAEKKTKRASAISTC